MTDGTSHARETTDIRVGAAAGAMVGVLVLVVAAVFALYGFYRMRAPNASFVPPKTFAAPQLQTQNDGLRDPGIAQQQARLHVYAWIDHSRGVVQIPIDRAMALIAARGDKAYDPITTATGAIHP